MIFGLGAAVGWGVADVFAAVSGRRIGAWTTVVLAQVASALLASVVILLAGPDLARLGSVAGWLVPTALLGAVAYAALYRALELGPIAVVSPVLASYAVLPVVLAVVILHESLTASQAVGAATTILGAVLTSTDLRALLQGTHRIPPGLPWALASALLFGVGAYVLGWASRRAGWLPSLWLARASAAGLFILAAAVLRGLRCGLAGASKAGRPSLAVPVSAVGLAVLVGLVDLSGTMAYSRGAEVDVLSIVTAVSATYPIVPVAGGIALFGERPAPNQLLGVAMVIAGLMLLGLA